MIIIRRHIDYLGASQSYLKALLSVPSSFSLSSCELSSFTCPNRAHDYLGSISETNPSSPSHKNPRTIFTKKPDFLKRYHSNYNNSIMTRQECVQIISNSTSTNTRDIVTSASTNNKRNLHQSGSCGNDGREQAISDKNTPSITSTRAYNSYAPSMASIQKLATEPSREHIENIRKLLKNTKAKDENDQQITLEKDDSTGIGSICIRSAAKNGISAKMMCDFLDRIDELYSWQEGKGVIIYGHNGFFCSGGDLVSVRELANYEDGLKMATLMQYNLARLQALPLITMALIQGKAIGGGAEIAATTDLRLMTKTSRIGYVHCRVGIVAAWGGGSRLVQLVGPSRAVELMSSGRLVDADEALSFGLVNSTIDDTSMNNSQVLEEAKKYLRAHISGAKSTIVAIKSLVNAARTLPLEQALVVEGQILSSTWGKPPHLEALNNNVKHRGE